VHAALGHLRQQAVGVLLKLGDGRLNHHRRDAVLAEGEAQLLVDALFLAERALPRLELDLPLAGRDQRVEALLGIRDLPLRGALRSAPLADLVAAFARLVHARLQLLNRGPRLDHLLLLVGQVLLPARLTLLRRLE
jgi:hypothetical protein